MSGVSSTCIVCRRTLPEGGRVLSIKGYHICPACENKIVSLSADKPEYHYFITGLKKIWSSPSK